MEAEDRVGAQSPSVAVASKSLGGRFLLRRRLGEGGFGTVHEADDLREGTRVALKILRHPEAEWLYRFKREFRAVQGLTHPGLVALDELFCEDDQWFFTMELIDGETFVDHVRAGRSNPQFHEVKLRRALGLLCEGLAALHAAGKVHRDIKPSNVLVTPEGRVVLIDFGLVIDSASTTLSHSVGTPAYMAPEQVSPDVGPAADLYAVGVMLYEILTGRLPFEGAAIQVLLDKQTGTPASPAAIAAGIPADLDALCMALLRPKAERRPDVAEVLGILATNRPQVSSPARRSGSNALFVGRAAERARLKAAFAASKRGHLVLALVSGESGIGKSHLVRCFIDELIEQEPNVMVLAGRCYEREAIPYKAIDGIVDALSRELSRMPAHAAAAFLPTHRSVLTRLFPVMLRVPQLAKDDAGKDDLLEPRELRRRGFLALRELVTRLARDRPTIIAIDDLQWADEDGLQAVAEIIRGPEAPPILFVGTMRGTQRGEGEALARLGDAVPSEVCTIELVALGEHDARDLAANLLQRTETTGADPDGIARAAGGHPLFVEEIVRRAASGAPGGATPSLEDAIVARLAELDGPSRELVELAAIAGRPLPNHVAATTAQLTLVDFRRRVAILSAANLVRTSDGRSSEAIEPYHDRIRAAVLAGLAPRRRQQRHQALALAFEESPRPDPETLALHWREAGQSARAALHAGAAGDQAASTFAFDRAASWYQQSLELLSPDGAGRRDLHVKAGDAFSLAGRGVMAAPHFQAAAAVSDGVEALELRRRAAEQLLRSGRFDRGLEATRLVLAAVGLRIPTSRFGTLAALLYNGLVLRVRGLRFHERDKKQVTARQRMRMTACWSLGMSLSGVNTFLGVAFLRRSLRLALTAGDLDLTVRALATVAIVGGTTRGSGRRTARLVHLTRELSARSDRPEARGFAAMAAGGESFYRSSYGDAARHIGQALDAFEGSAADLFYERATSRMHLLWSYFYLGRFKDLRARQAEWLRDALARGDVYAAATLTVGLANVAWLVEDRPDRAESETRAAMERWSARGFHLQHHFALLAQVRIRQYLGDTEAAHAVAEEMIARTRRSDLWRMPNVRLRALYARGIAALAMVERGKGERTALLRETANDAQAIARTARMQPFAKVLRAGVLHHRGEREGALALLDAAAREFREGGQSAYALATRDRMARLRADAGTAEEISEVAKMLRAEDVVVPERMIDMLAPRFGDATARQSQRQG